MKYILHSLICVTIFASFATIVTSGPKQAFSLNVAEPKEPLTAGEDLRLLVTVTNTSNRSISFITSPGPIPEDWFRYKIDVRDPHGRPAPPSNYLRRRDKRVPLSYGSSFARTLRPGQSFVDQVTVTKSYDLSRPGKYTIRLALPMPPRQNLGEGEIKSNTVTITVTE